MKGGARVNTTGVRQTIVQDHFKRKEKTTTAEEDTQTILMSTRDKKNVH